MFKMTLEWLRHNYGSDSPQQVADAEAWLKKYGKDVDPNLISNWAQWKHLIEYQPNTPDIIPQTMRMMNEGFETELDAHMFVNLLRVPLAYSYFEACEYVLPRMILEVGVGGDSAISTSVFLRAVERNSGFLWSVDLNPLGKTWVRYGKYTQEPCYWNFQQRDSVTYLTELYAQGRVFDLIFIDSSHTYMDTIEELTIAKKMTRNILMDDATFTGNDFDLLPGGVKRAIEVFQFRNEKWIKREYWNGGVVLLTNVGEKE